MHQIFTTPPVYFEEERDDFSFVDKWIVNGWNAEGPSG